MTLTAEDGHEYRGAYLGAYVGSGQPFSTTYVQWRMALPDSLRPPALRRTVLVHLRTDAAPPALTTTFLGFDRDTAYFESDGSVTPIAWPSIGRLMDPDGRQNALPSTSSPAEGTPPFVESIVLRDGERRSLRSIPWAEIDGVVFRPRKNGLRTGLLIGGTIDLIGIIIFIAIGGVDFDSFGGL